MQERRRHPRFEEKAVVTFEQTHPNPKDQQVEIPCWLLGVSEGGALLRTEAPLPREARLYLHIQVHDPADGFLEIPVQAEVRWHREIAQGGPYSVGVEFLQIADGARHRLHEALARRALDKDAAPEPSV